MTRRTALHPRLSRPRALAALGVAVGVVALHALLLGRLPQTPGPARAGLAALQVRQVWRPLAMPAMARDAPTLGLPPARPSLAPLPAPRVAAATPRIPPAATPRVPASAPIAVAAAATPKVPAAATRLSTTDTGTPAAVAAPAGALIDITDITESTQAAGQPPPVYATQLPPAVTLQYAVRRAGPTRPGLQAELRWRPDDGRYTLSLGFAAIGWASMGALDLHGLAPERHVETRRGRELRAVNFQRDSARITFSGPPAQHALLPGVQDRLSWMLQLPAVIAANPGLAEAGAEVLLQVVSVRGDAAVWRFAVQGREDIDLPAGMVAGALHLRREPQRPYDTRVDVWLDPARHHLPVRVHLQTRAEGEGIDFTLLHVSQP